MRRRSGPSGPSPEALAEAARAVDWWRVRSQLGRPLTLAELGRYRGLRDGLPEHAVPAILAASVAHPAVAGALADAQRHEFTRSGVRRPWREVDDQ